MNAGRIAFGPPLAFIPAVKQERKAHRISLRVSQRGDPQMLEKQTMWVHFEHGRIRNQGATHEVSFSEAVIQGICG
jgi:hypothetical protein